MKTETVGPVLSEDVVATGSHTTTSGMRIVCSRDELVAKVGIVSRAVSTRGTVQVLSGILLSAGGEGLSIAATDMELSLRTTLEAEVDGDGAVVIPGSCWPTLRGCCPRTR